MSSEQNQFEIQLARTLDKSPSLFILHEYSEGDALRKFLQGKLTKHTLPETCSKIMGKMKKTPKNSWPTHSRLRHANDTMSFLQKLTSLKEHITEENQCDQYKSFLKEISSLLVMSLWQISVNFYKEQINSWRPIYEEILLWIELIQGHKQQQYLHTFFNQFIHEHLSCNTTRQGH